MSTLGSHGGSGHATKGRDSRTDGFLLVGILAAVMWVSEVIDQLADNRLDQYGIVARQVDGLDGIVFSPFLHGSFGHLIGNTIPFLLLGAVIAFNGAARVALVTLIVAGLGGLGTWLIAPENSVTIGASGVVMGYATYLIARGIFSRRLLELVLGGVVAVLWGGMVLGSLVPRDGVSWQAHLCGGIAGVVAAWLLTKDRSQERDVRAPHRTPVDVL
ncbi:rhomboid family intramembrane serine protease [Patulibacter sp.]|uniref:rhomboid family intramembrane serine protease n=1 Tax=Patulibacter sp. TaxID=1912859 RepID=UPI00271D314D|nr:rhomboid family intramembrane serine protease [Patulibacter sp.]MDO9409843.1 rhomboid family intramembrane serine protease [Patulibacter sp.]